MHDTHTHTHTHTTRTTRTQDHCVVDFVLLNEEPVIIELNPFVTSLA